MLHALRARWLAEIRVDPVQRQAADLVPVSEVPDCVQHLATVEGCVVGTCEIAARILGNDNKRLGGKNGSGSADRRRPESLGKIPVLDIGKIVNTETIDVILAEPKPWPLIKEFPAPAVIFVLR